MEGHHSTKDNTEEAVKRFEVPVSAVKAAKSIINPDAKFGLGTRDTTKITLLENSGNATVSFDGPSESSNV